jgi:hypothetical protein
MTQPTGTLTIQQNELHQWAMDLSHFASKMTGSEPFHRDACRIEAIAARMEERAANEQPERNSRWKSILYRSAGWMYLKASEDDPQLLQDSARCAENALNLHPSDAPGLLLDLQREIELRSSSDYQQPEPTPWLTCFKCRIPITWSQHKPRKITANETHPVLDSSTVVAHLCSQCEWQAITGNAEPPRIDPARTALLVQTILDIETTLRDHDRPEEANEIALHLREDRIGPLEATALVITASREWTGTQNLTHKLLAAIHSGRLTAFGVPPTAPQQD